MKIILILLAIPFIIGLYFIFIKWIKEYWNK